MRVIEDMQLKMVSKNQHIGLQTEKNLQT